MLFYALVKKYFTIPYHASALGGQLSLLSPHTLAHPSVALFALALKNAQKSGL